MTCIEPIIKIEAQLHEINEPNEHNSSYQPENFEAAECTQYYDYKSVQINVQEECPIERPTNNEHESRFANESRFSASQCNARVPSYKLENVPFEGLNVKLEIPDEYEGETIAFDRPMVSRNEQQRAIQFRQQQQQQKKSKNASKAKPATKVPKPKKNGNLRVYKCRLCNEMLSKNCWSYHMAVKHGTTRFDCDICKAKFPTKNQIRKHMSIHDPSNYRFKCDLCDSLHQSKELLIEHRQVHVEKGEFTEATIDKPKMIKTLKRLKCKFKDCTELISSSNWAYHMASKHGANRLHCDICKKSFSCKSHIRKHMLVHDPMRDQYRCELCGSTYSTKGTYDRHCRTAHVTGQTKADIEALKVRQQQGIPKKPNNARLNKNILRYKCKVEGCDVLLSTNNRGWHMDRYHNKNMCECDICKKTFPTKTQIRAHILNVHDPSSRKFKCNLCKSAFVTKGALTWHHKLWHLRERNFMCSECGKTYPSKAMLRMHNSKHTGEKLYECTFEGCTKRFRMQSTRWEHLRVHTGEKPYPCVVEGCGRRFAYPIDLKRHKFNAHRIYTKKFPCTICAEIFPENMLLKKHMLKHGTQM